MLYYTLLCYGAKLYSVLLADKLLHFVSVTFRAYGLELHNYEFYGSRIWSVPTQMVQDLLYINFDLYQKFVF